MPTTATPFFAASPSPSWKDVTYVHYTPCLFPSPRVLNLWFSLCSIAEKCGSILCCARFHARCHKSLWYHPSNDLGAILAVTNHLARQGKRVTGQGRPRVHDRSTKDPGRSCTALLVQPRRPRTLIKVASTAIVSKFLYVPMCPFPSNADNPTLGHSFPPRPVARPDHRHHLAGMGRWPVTPDILPCAQHRLPQVLGHRQCVLTHREPSLPHQAQRAGPGLGAVCQDVGPLRRALQGPPVRVPAPVWFVRRKTCTSKYRIRPSSTRRRPQTPPASCTRGSRPSECHRMISGAFRSACKRLPSTSSTSTAHSPTLLIASEFLLSSDEHVHGLTRTSRLACCAWSRN